jgi:peptide/nickel transport system substrate-binding protein
MRWKHSLAVAVTGMALVAAACSSGGSGAGPSTTGSPATTGGPTSGASSSAPSTTTTAVTTTGASPSGRTSLAIGETLAPASLDITQDSGAQIPQALLYNVYETLVKISDDGSFAPLLAKAYTVSDDGLTYTFTLNSGVKFANGDPLTAKEVVASLTHNQTNKSAPPLIASTFALVNRITNPDADTVVVTLKQRSRDFLFDLAQTAGAIVDQKTLAQIKTTSNGSGPFAVDSYTTNAALVLRANPTYWGAKPALQQVTFKYYSDANALSNALKAGDVDIVDNLTPELFGDFQKDTGHYDTVNGTTSGEVLLAFNNSRKPLDDVRVRQALTYAINKKDVDDIAEQGLAKIIGSHASTNDPWFEDLSTTYPFDPAKAKDLLKEAGVSNLSLTLDVIPTPYAQASAPVIKDSLAKVGVTVKLNNVEFPQWLDKDFGKSDFDLTIVAHVEARDTNLYGNPNYYWKYNNPTVQSLLKQADAAPTDQQSNDLYHQVLEQINKDAVNDWLFLLPRLEVVKKGITGYPKGSYSLSYDVTGIKA